MADIADKAFIALLHWIHFFWCQSNVFGSDNVISCWGLSRIKAGISGSHRSLGSSLFFGTQGEERLVGCFKLITDFPVIDCSIALVPNASTWATLSSYQGIAPPVSQTVNWKVSGFKMALDMLSRSYHPSGRWWLLRKVVSWRWNASWNAKPLDLAFSEICLRRHLSWSHYTEKTDYYCLLFTPASLSNPAEWQVSVRGQIYSESKHMRRWFQLSCFLRRSIRDVKVNQ